jgi:hypothetical protein
MERFVKHIKCVLIQMDLVFSIEGAEKMVRMIQNYWAGITWCLFNTLVHSLIPKDKRKTMPEALGYDSR